FPALGIDYLQWTLSHMENFLGARKSLSKWASDQENLANIANHIHRLINNHEHYLNFMKNHLIGTRIDSPLAVEAFCRADTETIPLHSQLCLCTNNKFGIEQNYLICNGTKLNIDPHSMPIINHIAASPGTSLEDLIHNFPQHESTDIKKLITALCKEDILSITL
ncbi:winged helix domain-containing protein, partial [Pseudomonas aeruginosa]